MLPIGTNLDFTPPSRFRTVRAPLLHDCFQRNAGPLLAQHCPGTIYKATEGRGGGERRSSCLRGKRPAAFRDLCQIGYSGLFPLVPSAFCPLYLPSCRIVKSRSGSRKASNKRENEGEKGDVIVAPTARSWRHKASRAVARVNYIRLYYAGLGLTRLDALDRAIIS